MALEIRTELAPAVAVLEPVNTFILDRAFVDRRYFESVKVKFDLAKTSNKTAPYRSFLDKATVVEKDGYNTVEVPTLNINIATVRTAEDARYRGFGEPQFGIGQADPMAEQIRSELEGFGKLRAMAKRREVFAAYEALTTGKIQYGIDGIDEINFGIPPEQIETVSPDWTDSNADPIADMIAVYDEMRVKPTTVVLGVEAYHAFLNNPNVLTDRTDGKAQNFQKSDASQVGIYGQDVIRVGMLVDRPLEVVCDMSFGEIAEGDSRNLLDPKYATYVSGDTGKLLYGGVPIPSGDRVMNTATEFLPITVVEEDPAQVKDVYRSAPLPAITDPWAVWSQKVVS